MKIMKKIITTLVLLLITVVSTQAQQENLALTFANAAITNDGVNDYYEVDVMVMRTATSPDFKLGDGQFYVDYNPAAFGNNIDDVTVDFEYPVGSILAETNLLPVYSAPIINTNANGTVSIAWGQGLAAGAYADDNITVTPAVLGHLKIVMIDTNVLPNICFNVAGAGFDDQFSTACGPFTPGVAFADCTGANASTQIVDYDGSDCSGSVIIINTCTSTTSWTTIGGWAPFDPPTSTMNAIIVDDYNTSIHGNISACSITVRSGATLTIGALEFALVQTDITVDAGGEISVSHQGSIVQVSDISSVNNAGTISVLVDTPALDGLDFMLLGSPMSMETRADVFTGANVVRNHLTANFSPNTAVALTSPSAGNWLDQEGDDWPIHTGAINPGEGYFVFRDFVGPSTPLNLVYNTGTLNNGVVSYTTGYNVPGPTPADNQNASPNVVANPYASAISAVDFINGNTNVDAVYFWEHISTPTAGTPGPYGLDYTMEDLSIFNLTGGTAAGSAPSTTPNGIISTGQGFALKASSLGFITFNNAMRRTTGNTTLRNQDLDRIWLNVKSADYDLNSTALIGFLDEATNGIDIGYDNTRLATNVSLYSHLPNGSEQLGIQARSAFDEYVKIPMGFATLIDETIEYKISIQNMEGLNLGDKTAYLVDNQLNTVTNLNETNYTFVSSKGIFDNRFTLQFTRDGALGLNDSSLEMISLYPNPSKGVVNIVSPQTIVTSATVYDIRGRKVSQVNFSDQTNYQVDLSSMEVGVYFIDIASENGTVQKRLVKQN
jgi:hypothetical protein